MSNVDDLVQDFFREEKKSNPRVHIEDMQAEIVSRWKDGETVTVINPIKAAGFDSAGDFHESREWEIGDHYRPEAGFISRMASIVSPKATKKFFIPNELADQSKIHSELKRHREEVNRLYDQLKVERRNYEEAEAQKASFEAKADGQAQEMKRAHGQVSKLSGELSQLIKGIPVMDDIIDQ